MDNPHPNPASDWISDQAWSHLCELSDLAPPFNGLRESITNNPAAWRGLYDHPSPHTEVREGFTTTPSLASCVPYTL